MCMYTLCRRICSVHTARYLPVSMYTTIYEHERPHVCVCIKHRCQVEIDYVHKQHQCDGRLLGRLWGDGPVVV